MRDLIITSMTELILKRQSALLPMQHCIKLSFFSNPSSNSFDALPRKFVLFLLKGIFLNG
ncbi:hypothetical protein L195_g038793 [Trifolium pratense]|uniref:Uncharacterized protein n=1 Tax=Trifolium pratense TaxID=57577 RepID=A0A2K3LW48_TRIPR|nr:hypothetical protein L195_g038793 [Trifolium pratense]